MSIHMTCENSVNVISLQELEFGHTHCEKPDDLDVWTGSCPCQPFSAAGTRAGFADERHLWPTWFHLIEERRPPAIFGEQVASKDANPWIDLVQDDMEALDYAFGAVPFPSAGVGAPHIRDRLYWVAHADGGAGRKGRAHVRGRTDGGDAQPWTGPCGRSLPGRLADSHQHGRTALPLDRRHDAQHHTEPCGEPGQLGHAQRIARIPCGASGADAGQAFTLLPGPGPTNGRWAAADWLLCRDGKWRPVEPGTSPLAHGAPARVGRLHAYGNAINAEAARIFIEVAILEIHPNLP